jgi:tetratricopeptide (TPR) repeat protein
MSGHPNPSNVAVASQSAPSDAPKNGYERFNEQARRVLRLARAEARKGHGLKRRRPRTVSSAHILLALLQLKDPPFRELSRSYNLRPDSLRAFLNKTPAVGPDTTWPSGVFTPGGVQAIMCAGYLSFGLGTDFLGPEHLLLGLASAEEGTAHDILLRHGANFASLLRTVRGSWTDRGLQAVPLAERYLGAVRAMMAGHFDEAAPQLRLICDSWPSGGPRLEFAACLALSDNADTREEGLRTLWEMLALTNEAAERSRVRSYLAEVMARRQDVTTKELDEAEGLARAALEDEPDGNQAALSALTWVLIRRSRFDEATAVARELSQLARLERSERIPLSCAASLGLGGDELVASLFREMRLLADAEARCTLSLALIGTERIAEARRLFEEAKGLAPSIEAVREVEDALSDVSG